jgi:hypothetical protein
MIAGRRTRLRGALLSCVPAESWYFTASRAPNNTLVPGTLVPAGHFHDLPRLLHCLHRRDSVPPGNEDRARPVGTYSA